MLWLSLLSVVSTTTPARDAGILYEVWHAPAAYLMQRVEKSGASQPKTVEGSETSAPPNPLKSSFHPLHFPSTRGDWSGTLPPHYTGGGGGAHRRHSLEIALCYIIYADVRNFDDVIC